MLEIGKQKIRYKSNDFVQKNICAAGKVLAQLVLTMGRPVPLDKAGQVIGYWRNGRSYTEISRELHLHRNTVYGVIKRFRERGTLVPRRSTGRKRITTARDDRTLFRIVRNNR